MYHHFYLNHSDRIIKLDSHTFHCNNPDVTEDEVTPIIWCLPRGRYLSGYTLGYSMISAWELRVYHTKAEAIDSAIEEARMKMDRIIDEAMNFNMEDEDGSDELRDL